MALPKVRQTRSRTNKRRSHHSLKRVSGVKCSKCGEMTLSHAVCKNCGFYKEVEVLDVMKKKDKKKDTEKKKA